MYEVTIIKSFSAAHMLAAIGGKCEELHGHNFKVEVTVSAKHLNSSGILIDFRHVKKWLQEILDRLDHKNLNEITFFTGENPSSENIAKYICREMELKSVDVKVRVSRVKVWESENAAVSYIPDNIED
ncbi:MAG: 6-carboxy-5,6,7,8-tetrahydropterin synthase [Smithella sp. PtaU1.Bin162]|nr:MAG: 6-carboxy-5,6,7,8-tetrahydropterin synthase [Smithella sp. PtaU1.Bin162]